MPYPDSRDDLAGLGLVIVLAVGFFAAFVAALIFAWWLAGML